MRGTAFCPHCDVVGMCAAQIACWGHEWKAVAWMALTLWHDYSGSDDGASITRDLYDEYLPERWAGNTDDCAKWMKDDAQK